MLLACCLLLLQVVALAWLLHQGVVPLVPVHWSSQGVAAGTRTAAGPPWALSLGLQHHQLTTPPALCPATPGAKQVAEEEAAGDGEAGVQEAAAESGGPGPGGSTPSTSDSSSSFWMDDLSRLLQKDDLVEIQALMGGPASSAAA